MAFQLIKHIFNFFYPNETENQNDPDRPGPLPSFGDLIPCYDRSGNVIAYLPASVQTTQPSHDPAHSVPNPPPLPQHMKHHSQELFELCTDTKSIPRLRARSVSPSAARTNQRRGPDQSSNSLRPKSGGGDELWDPWPDGDFERLLTWEEVLRTDNLSEHWACQPGGGDKRGSESALVWSQGKKTRRVCLGVITCDEPTCEVVTRPQTRRAGIMGQLNASCLCGSQLKHIDCGVTSITSW
ncbi:uncharacterized protein F5891DRAFT_1279888 [Suillus fuscotomentosus]|uniref:Uncharacterized protein n=1 Tax=Suillus fuscotomentosus TaxID=1912939 RepID=A0AAD4HJE1_9AGAM|nr:uncharacterized protein F5891DRAFT_1279888 [Suillus fuscotomentosus]KAG1897644.1 hypothetical protein F5891DRAFT_1279888 [Suillus fuscotomentosus]